MPHHSIRQILEQWNNRKEPTEFGNLYHKFKKYFEEFNDKNKDFFAHTAELFKNDEILNTIKIDDKILYNHLFRLSKYDFVNEIEITLLGHIFENSLQEIDEIKTQLQGLFNRLSTYRN